MTSWSVRNAFNVLAVGKRLGVLLFAVAAYYAAAGLLVQTFQLHVLEGGRTGNPNVMDREPFAKWDIFSDEPAPVDVITLLQKSQFNAELIRTFAQRQRAQNLLVSELTRLLEPASEFTKLAVANIETRNLTQAVTESWKPIVASALKDADITSVF